MRPPQSRVHNVGKDRHYQVGIDRRTLARALLHEGSKKLDNLGTRLNADFLASTDVTCLIPTDDCGRDVLHIY